MPILSRLIGKGWVIIIIPLNREDPGLASICCINVVCFMQNPGAEPAAPVGGSWLRAAAGLAVGAGVAGRDAAPVALARPALHRAVQHAPRAGPPAGQAQAGLGARPVLPPPRGAQEVLAARPVQRRAPAVPVGRLPSPQERLGPRPVQRPPCGLDPGPVADDGGAHDPREAAVGPVPLLLHVLVTRVVFVYIRKVILVKCTTCR